MNDVRWYGPAFRRALEAEMDRRVARAALVVERQAKRLLSVSGTGMLRGGLVVPAAKTGRKRVYGAFPSRPGDPPHKQTGRLRASVTWERVKTGVARVGTNVKYARPLELGTWKMKARPWLVRSLRDMTSQVQTILSAPWRAP